MSTAWKRTALIAALGIFAPLPAGAVPPGAPKLVVHNVQRIYHPATFSEKKTYGKVAAVSSRLVFDATPEYRQIARRKLSPTSAEWTILVKAASDKFKTAVAKAAADAGYDLVAETGAVALDGGKIDDATSAVIARLNPAPR
jgi:hypothetical protein